MNGEIYDKLKAPVKARSKSSCFFDPQSIPEWVLKPFRRAAHAGGSGLVDTGDSTAMVLGPYLAQADVSRAATSEPLKSFFLERQ